MRRNPRTTVPFQLEGSMWISNHDDWWDYSPQSIGVTVKETRQSLVLDQNGEPFKLEEKNPVGFDLRRKYE